MNRQRAEEFFIRNYFRLFETEADAHRVLSQQLELHYDRKNEYPEYVSIFKQYWPILKEMEISKAVLFMKLIPRSEEHTSELQSRPHLVCRLLLEKKK